MPTPGAPVAPARLTWLGHSTVVLRLGETVLVTDPVLRARMQHLRRHVPRPTLHGHVDAVLVSHAHHDHLDLPSLRALPDVGLLVLPRGLGRLVRRAGAGAVAEVAPGDERTVGDVAIRVVHAEHSGRREPLGPTGPALGFVLEHAGRRAYFAGDTGLFDGMAAIGPVDVALLPIWGWGPSLGPGHMDPEQAAQAAALVRPRVVVPIHWGTYLPIGARRRHGALLRTPAAQFARAMADAAPGVEVVVLAPGGELDLAGARSTARG